MSEIRECLFYIDYNLPEGCGIRGDAIHKGACRLNSTDCNNTPECFIKKLHEQLQVKEQECEELKKELTSFMNGDYCANGCSLRQKLDQLKEENEEMKVMFKDLSYENQKLGYKIEEQTKQLEPFKDEYFK